MNEKVYAIFDRILEMCGPLFTARNEKHAIRLYRQMLVNSKVDNESDYMLYCFGEFDPYKPCLLGDLVPTIIDTSEDDDE